MAKDSEIIEIDWDSFPDVNTKKPGARRPLFINTFLSPTQIEALERKGWQIIDVRTLPDDTLEQRASNVLSFLSGVRFGSIVATQTMFKFIELESRITGLYTAKGTQAKPKDLDPEDEEALLSFAKRK
jgi:hypothetical protein